MSIILSGVNGKDGTLRPGAFGTATLVVPDRGVGALVTVSVVQQRLQRLTKALEAAQAENKKNAKENARIAQQAAHQTKVGRGLPKRGDGALGSVGGGGGGSKSHFGIFDFLEAGAAMVFGKRLLSSLVGRFGSLLKFTGGGIAAILRPSAALNFMTKVAAGLGTALKIAGPMFEIAALPTMTTPDEDRVLNAKTQKEKDAIVKQLDDRRDEQIAAMKAGISSAWKSLSKATFEYAEDIKTWIVQQSQSLGNLLSETANKLRAAVANFDLKTLMQEWLGKIKEWVSGIHTTPFNPNNTPPSEMTPGDLQRNRDKDSNFRRDPESYKFDPTRVGGSAGKQPAATTMPSGASPPSGAEGFTHTGPVGAIGEAKPIPVKTANGVELQNPDDMRGQAVGGGDATEGIKDFARIMAGSADLPGGFQEVTALNDLYHAGSNSKHAMGLATDFTLKDGSRQNYEAANEYIRNRLHSAGLRDDQFWIEPTSQTSGPGSTAPHIHVQFQSAADAAQFAAWAKTNPDAQKAMNNIPDTAIKPNPKGLFPKGNFTGRVGTSDLPDGNYNSSHLVQKLVDKYSRVPKDEEGPHSIKSLGGGYVPSDAWSLENFDVSTFQTYYGPHSSSLLHNYNPGDFQKYGPSSPKRLSQLSDSDLGDFMKYYATAARTDEDGLSVADQGELAYKKAKDKWAAMHAPFDVSPPTTTIAETLPTITQDQIKGPEAATNAASSSMHRRRATMDDIPTIHPDANMTVHHHSDNY